MAKSSADTYIGMTKKEAQNRAEADGITFRLIRIDEEEYFSYPTDKRDDRVCVEIDKGKVSKAAIS